MSLATWFLTLCLALPYQPYISYLDLGMYLGPQLKGVGLCVTSLSGLIKQYSLILVIVMYFLPVKVMIYLYMCMNRELQHKQRHMYVVYKRRISTASASSSTRSNMDKSQCELREDESQGSSLWKDKQHQQYLGVMSAICSICLCPLMVLRLVKTYLAETYGNSNNYDILYTVFVWLTFVPTVTSPLIVLHWQIEKTWKTTLLRCFRTNHVWWSQSQRPAETPACLLPGLENHKVSMRKTTDRQ